MSCPICGANLVNEYKDYMDGFILMESLWKCPNGHYSDHYVTGYTAITIYEEEVHFSYHDYDNKDSKDYNLRKLREFDLIAKGKQKWEAENGVN